MSTSTHTLPELGQEDMSREFSLAYSNVVKYMQGERLPTPHPTPPPLPAAPAGKAPAGKGGADGARAAAAGARMKLPWVGNGYVAFEAHEPKMQRRLVMRSQYVKVLDPAEEPSFSSGGRVMSGLASAVNNDFTATCTLSKLGRTSLDLYYQLKVGQNQVATGLSAMVCVGGETGARKPDPVPESVRPFLEESEEAAAAAADSAAMMEGFPLAADVVGETYVYKTRIRYSVRASTATDPPPPPVLPSNERASLTLDLECTPPSTDAAGSR